MEHDLDLLSWKKLWLESSPMPLEPTLVVYEGEEWEVIGEAGMRYRIHREGEKPKWIEKGECTPKEGGIVSEPKPRDKRWQQVLGDLKVEISTLHDAIVSLVPDEDAGEIVRHVEVQLTALTSEMKSAFDEALDEDVKQGDSGYGFARQVIDLLRSELTTVPLMVALRENTLCDGSKFERAFLACFDDLQAGLST